MLVLNYQAELGPHGARRYLRMKGIGPLNCPYEPLSPNTPFFSLRFLSPWVTVARLQPRPVGPCKPRPERLAVWVTAPPLPALSYKGVLTTLALLFVPQNTPPTPNLALCWERESQAGESRVDCWKEEGGSEWGGRGWMGACWQCGVSVDSH